MKKIWFRCLVVLCLATCLPGCSWLSTKAPVAEACLPTPAALATQIATILATGGDYVAKLEALAAQDGSAVVICAVQAFLSAPGASDASVRAHHYLVLKGAE